jgi:hypothetical protein
MDPTPLQLERLRAYVQYGSLKAAAHALHVPLQTFKNNMAQLYARLDVSGEIEALKALGWITLPEVGPRYVNCGWIGTCGRPFGHRGQHGGFRHV